VEADEMSVPKYPVRKGDENLFGRAAAVFELAEEAVESGNVLGLSELHPDALLTVRKAVKRLEAIFKATGRNTRDYSMRSD
jgi:hypothetical protein